MAGYPPPNYGYGPPPPNQQPPYGAPQPGVPYGAPPPGQPYGAPPPGQPYGAPPPDNLTAPHRLRTEGSRNRTSQQPHLLPTAHHRLPTRVLLLRRTNLKRSKVDLTFTTCPTSDPAHLSLRTDRSRRGIRRSINRLRRPTVDRAADRDGSGFIDDKELQAALSSYNQSFSLRTVHLLMYLFTNSNSRKIGPKEFTQVFYSLQNWRSIFERFDRDRSGTIDPPELREALLSLGFSVSPVVLDLLVLKFDKSGGKSRAIEYDNFIECCLTVKGLTEKFKEKDTSVNGLIQHFYSISRSGCFHGELRILRCLRQELIVIDDLLSALVGIEGRCVSIKKVRAKDDEVHFQIDPSMDLTLQELAKRIFPLCKSFLLINQFVESRSQFKKGLVNHAFAAALSALLLDYQAMVAQLEHQFRLRRLSIQGLWFYIQPMMGLMQALSIVIKKVVADDMMGSSVLNLLQSQAKAMAGDSAVRSFLEKMAQCASSAYLSILESEAPIERSEGQHSNSAAFHH
ncbi:unnamed protein product [Rhodiola kirilowii]